MKTTKLMLSAFIAAVALVACNKEDHTPVKTDVMSMTISLENAIMTRGASTGDIVSGSQVQVNNLHIRLLDDHGNTYKAYVLNGDGTVTEADMYLDFTSSAIPSKIEYHYVDPAVTKVVAYANLGANVNWDEYNGDIVIEDEQNPDALALYGEDAQLTNAGEKTHDNGDVTVLYKAELTLCPRISRFELDGFRIAFTDEKPNYGTINISKVAFQNYYPASNVVTGVESGTLLNPITNLENDFLVFDWFNNTGATPGTDEWYWDNVNANLIKDAPAVQTNYSYHFFSCGEVPVMVIDIVADGRPAYLYTKSFSVKDDNGNYVTLDKIEEGKVYRMNAASTADGNDDGYVEIPEDLIDPANHCIDITVTVENWVVKLVQPNF